MCDTELVLCVNGGLTFDTRGEEGWQRLDLLPQHEHLLVREDSEAKVEEGGDARDEVKGDEIPEELLHGK